MLSQQMKDIINQSIMEKFGIPYENFAKLDIEEQQRLIREYHKKHREKFGTRCHTIIGTDEDSLFVNVKKGERILIGSGEDSCFITWGVTPEEERKKLDSDFDRITSKRLSFLIKPFRGSKRH